MRNNTLLAILFLVPQLALAWPGGEGISCKSLPGAKVNVDITLGRSYGDTPDMPARIEATIGAKHYVNEEPEPLSISIVSHPKDGVITGQYGSFNEEKKEKTKFTIWARPRTIKVHEKACEGTANFRAGFQGWIENWDDQGGVTEERADQDLDCEYSHHEGSAC
jgi:hypothetical protein